MTVGDHSYFDYWGKAGADLGGDTEGEGYHLLVYHSLDVAAVGHVLLRSDQHLLNFLASAAEADAIAVERWLLFLLALHDLGKFSGAFQKQRPDIVGRWGKKPSPLPYDLRHDSLGYLLWREIISKDSTLNERLALSEGDFKEWSRYLRPWARAVTCHHGQPDKIASRHRPVHYFAPDDISAANAFAHEVAGLLLEPPPPPHFSAPLAMLRKQKAMERTSWWLAGFTVLCDWLGSNRAFFPYQSEPMPLKRYWEECALPNAERGVAAAGVTALPVAQTHSIQGLFRFIEESTPLQQRVTEIPLHSGPQLFILEEVTGSGKSEAALLLVNRLMAAGKAQGLYFALPTMATANAMFQRTAEVYQKLFEAKKDLTPSLVLAHGSAHLVAGFTDSIVPLPVDGDSDYEPTEASASSHCAAWLADHPKKALLAHVGVGTVDQALLAILKSRHQAFRLEGLRGKVLVVDEVHAADDYMRGALARLLEFHAYAGGSAVLLSATLPQAHRAKLVEAFHRGLKSPPPLLTEKAYPLLTVTAREGVHEERVESRESVRRSLRFRLLNRVEQVFHSIEERVSHGRCICWVRNSVADAIEAFEQLRDRRPQAQITLFHARFALQDRLDIETQVLARFGKGSRAADRRGQILIATQVVEQSLDLDFDAMISDLAPMDLLLQRAGRLQRHCRDVEGNIIVGADQRGGAQLEVLAPEPSDDAGGDWLSGVLPRTAKIYPHIHRLWNTARRIQERGVLQIPSEVRCWIEAIYGEEGIESVPEGIREASKEAEGEDLTRSGLARLNTIVLDAGYKMEGVDWWDETKTPTRLGEPTVTLRLARWEEQRLTPWAQGSAHPWAMSELRILEKWVAREADYSDEPYAAQAERAKAAWPGRPEAYILVLLEPGEHASWQGRAANPNGESVLLRYSAEVGLIHMKGES